MPLSGVIMPTVMMVVLTYITMNEDEPKGLYCTRTAKRGDTADESVYSPLLCGVCRILYQ